MRLLALLLTIVALADTPTGPPPTGGWVGKVYDGDTLTMESGDKVRLRWVNTPELRPAEAYGEEAKRFATEFALRQQVRLLVGPEPRDGYGRVIAGVRRGERDLSLELVKAGLAHVFIIPPENHDITPLLAAQKEARAARRGIWSTESYKGALHITSFHANAPGDDRENINGEYLRVCNVSGEEVDMADFTIRNARGDTFMMPSVYVPAGHTVLVHSGKGAEQPNVLQQLSVYLGSDRPIWNNDGDEVQLLGPDGQVVDRRRYK